MTRDDVLARLTGVRAAGAGYMALCPAHDDTAASLSITDGDRGVLMHCHAGCATPAICEVLGIDARELFYQPRARAARPNRSRAAAARTRDASVPRRKLVRAYDYRDTDGRLLYQACRFEPKTFRQRRPDPACPERSDRWLWNLDDTPRVLYRLPELRASGATTVLIAEGEKDADALAALGFASTTAVGGASKSAKHPKWTAAYTQQLVDVGAREAIILPDNDEPGQAHAQAIAASVQAAGLTVRVVNLPGLGPKGDVSDYLDAGHRRADLDEQIAAAPVWTPSAASTTERTRVAPTTGKGRESQATALVALARAEQADFFHDPKGLPFVALATPQGGRQTLSLRSTACRDWLARLYYLAHRTAPGAQGVADALTTLAGLCRFDGDARPVYTRVAPHGNAIYLDLADDTGHAIEITAAGWTIAQTPPVHFRRSGGMLALAPPVSGGSLDDLRRLLNIDHADTWALMAGWMIGALSPTGPYPVLNLTGEQGTAKSTAARFLRGLIDPNAAPLRSEPREARDLMIAASNGWVIVLDNLSSIREWLSDALCRLSTGGGFSTRQLFSDGEEIIFDAQRPIILTGIEQVATSGDLIDRGLFANLPVISDRARRDERELFANYEALRPALLGALLDAVVCALARRDTVQLASKPRLADFAKWMTAAELALGWAPGHFLAAYTANRQAASEANLDGDTVAGALRARLAEHGDWCGTAGELLAALSNIGNTAAKDWPTTARALAGRLKRLAPGLRRVGIEVSHPPREAGTGRRMLSIVTTVTPSQGQQIRPELRDDCENPTVTSAAAIVTDIPRCAACDDRRDDASGRPSQNPTNVFGPHDDRDGRDGRFPFPVAVAAMDEELKL